MDQGMMIIAEQQGLDKSVLLEIREKQLTKPGRHAQRPKRNSASINQAHHMRLDINISMHPLGLEKLAPASPIKVHEGASPVLATQLIEGNDQKMIAQAWHNGQCPFIRPFATTRGRSADPSPSLRTQ